MNPGVSFTRIVRRSIESQNAIASSAVSGDVLSAEMTSARRKAGGGLKK